MALALRPPRVPKPKSGLPSHYHESFLEKKGPRDRVESLESREMWKGFILTVVELRVPSNLTLLPGHLYMMAEALAKEEARRALEMPSCFLKVSRLEAQLLLERHPECGNLLLRPSGDGAGGVSVSTLQTLNGTPVVQHYKVKREGPKYVIDVKEPFSCTSLDAVVNYFVSHSNKKLMPFLLDDDYEKVIGYVEADKENGESVWVTASAPSAPSAPGPGPAPPRGGPKQLPPSSIAPVSSQDKLPPLLNQDENYVIPTGDAPAANYVNQDVPSPSRPVVPKPRKLAMFQAKPPIVPMSEPKKGLNSGLARKLAVSSAQAFSSPTTGLADVTAELKGKLQRRLALEHAAECTGDQRANLQAWRVSQADPSSQN
ncbi:signal-transducing adaptor protein 2 isoform X4 [Balaenoptera acutorostrata]|uniref:Signal-transducing adaptor protein 2 isoform X4 n=1 Tax=Balaenoptera acutorostrata TaxID=9767 RepID=A0ABM3T6J9_BALAC|nr:signal-transducing adaptor protein 2 isoform X4 [Balaenoptera acutorostrata]